jgi:hypothetical protein
MVVRGAWLVVGLHGVGRDDALQGKEEKRVIGAQVYGVRPPQSSTALAACVQAKPHEPTDGQYAVKSGKERNQVGTSIQRENGQVPIGKGRFHLTKG